jgi:hypothetical protein
MRALAGPLSPRRVLGVVLACALLGAPGAAAKEDPIPPELQKVREALDKYQDPVVAIRDGYFSTLGCVEYPKPGAAGQVPYRAGGMGVHFFNVGLMGKIDPVKPQVLVYQPVGGKLRLVAAEYFVPLTPEVKDRPQLFGRPFDGPMEGHHPLMPHELKHYDLHVWLWKKNPSGLFSPTNPDVKCPNGAYTFKETAPALVTRN